MINLDRREDRWAASAPTRAVPPFYVERLSAVEDIAAPGRGCLASHLVALSKMPDRGGPLLVMEDDWEWNTKAGWTWPRIERLLQEAPPVWDVLMLCRGTAVLHAGTGDAEDHWRRVTWATSSAAYLVRPDYVARLAGVWEDALQKWRAEASPVPSRYKHALDVAWRPLQEADRWFLANHNLGRQRAGFSDIEQRYTDYTTA